jgi:hypothetical protein
MQTVTGLVIGGLIATGIAVAASGNFAWYIYAGFGVGSGFIAGGWS